jgi:uncharacterized protein (TIGR02246 family)
MPGRISLPLLIALLLFCATPAHSQAIRISGISDADAAEILRLAEAGDSLWNAKDAAGLGALYTEDAHNWMVGTEMNLRGRDSIAAFFTRSFARRGPGLRHRTVVTELQMVAPGVVAADGDVVVEQVAEGQPPRVLRRFTMSSVAVKGPDGWKLRINRVHPVPSAPAR